MTQPQSVPGAPVPYDRTARRATGLLLAVLGVGLGWSMALNGFALAILILLSPVAVIVYYLWRYPLRPRHDAIADKRRASDEPPVKIAKRIFLFSDGTNNSSAKPFKTNVWRLYQCIDFGPDQAGQVLQIGNYNNGVGTSTFKPFAILGGIFGFGLQRNVLHLYRFLCRNYQPGDSIHAFGFSRGAFTIRMLVALIASQGVLTDYVDERDLARKSAALYREFVRGNEPKLFPYVTRLVRFLRDRWIAFTGWLALDLTQDADNPVDHPDIDFVGVWDTVAAYGGPVLEITRGIDEWIAPLTMPDYMLSPKVKKARHALALDDERESFHPLVWDEVAEVERRGTHPNMIEGRLKQVWFCGMHADVGGGYPDDSLSYVSLAWMLDELNPDADPNTPGHIRMVAAEEKRIRDMANAFGPIHDSREGLASFYRYQPRKIDALLDHGGDQAMIARTLSLRDPRISRLRGGHLRGLLTDCVVHSSVLVRIATGTDNYVPLGLPEKFSIELSRHPFLGEAAGKECTRSVQQLTHPRVRHNRALVQEQMWNSVWLRRWIFFITLFLALALAAMPLWVDWIIGRAPEADGRWVGGIVAGLFRGVLPGFLSPWFASFDKAPFLFLFLLGGIIGSRAVGIGMEATLRDRIRDLWWAGLERRAITPGLDDWLTRLRHDWRYQRFLQLFKWRLVPRYVVGPLMLAGILYVLAVAGGQAWLSYAERSGRFCTTAGVPDTDRVPPESWPERVQGHLRLDDPCNRIGFYVSKGATYEVTLTDIDEWRDDSVVLVDHAANLPTDGFDSFFSSQAEADGSVLRAWGKTATFLLAAPFRRIVPAKWMQPLMILRNGPRFSDRLYMDTLKFEAVEPVIDQAKAGDVIMSADRPTIYRARFVAPINGEFFIAANDVGGRWFYRNNHGTAQVTIERTALPAED